MEYKIEYSKRFGVIVYTDMLGKIDFFYELDTKPKSFFLYREPLKMCLESLSAVEKANNRLEVAFYRVKGFMEELGYSISEK